MAGAEGLEPSWEINPAALEAAAIAAMRSTYNLVVMGGIEPPTFGL